MRNAWLVAYWERNFEPGPASPREFTNDPLALLTRVFDRSHISQGFVQQEPHERRQLE